MKKPAPVDKVFYNWVITIIAGSVLFDYIGSGTIETFALGLIMFATIFSIPGTIAYYFIRKGLVYYHETHYAGKRWMLKILLSTVILAIIAVSWLAADTVGTAEKLFTTVLISYGIPSVACIFIFE